MTDPEEDFPMAFFRRLPSQAQAESSNPNGSYSIKSTVVDGWLGLSIFLNGTYDEKICRIRTRRTSRRKPLE